MANTILVQSLKRLYAKDRVSIEKLKQMVKDGTLTVKEYEEIISK